MVELAGEQDSSCSHLQWRSYLTHSCNRSYVRRNSGEGGGSEQIDLTLDELHVPQNMEQLDDLAREGNAANGGRRSSEEVHEGVERGQDQVDLLLDCVK